MKNLVLALLLSFSGVSYGLAMDFVDPPVEWEFTEFNFAVIEQGKPVEVIFRVTNDNEGPLVIKNVKTSCGCTASDYSKEPILPGATSEIKATYNAAKLGKFTKTIRVYTNQSDEPVVLTIRGEVK
ncbi:DUF1573 domain-containing protein [Membranihabitans maritimus]|uniref:DUF1573 domain-containing protein n=1 Tax=Membranihabitans maritimus TaxID=2904244 RepID=UPI001F2DA5AA|nr:DUF1573 domain-containing protein [Membranihabitans maritimus]